MDLPPIIISTKTVSVSIVITFSLGIWLARAVVLMKSERWKMILDGILTLPLVLPPTVAGSLLLYLFGVKRPIGLLLNKLFSYKTVFTWQATVLAAAIISLPFMYRSARGVLEQVEEDLIYAARTLRLSEETIFWKIVLPVVRPGAFPGGAVAFARGLGEFGAAAMIAGNIAGKMRTLPLAAYSEVAANNTTQTGKYMAVIAAVSSLIMVGMNHVGRDRTRDVAKNRIKDRIKAGIKGQKETHGMSLTVGIQKKLKDITLDIPFEAHEMGDITGILGVSGCGKSMTLKCIAGIEIPDKGRVMLNDRVLFDPKRKINQRTQERRVGYLFQHYVLFPNMTVRQNVELALHDTKAEESETTSQYLELLHVSELADSYPFRFSGSQQQRVALARILTSKLDVLMLDEPFFVLDYYLKESLQLELLEVLSMYQGDILMVTRNRGETYRFCQNIYVLDQGQVITSGGTGQILKDPETIAAAKLIGCKNIEAIEIISGRHLRVPAWDADIHLQRTIPENTRAIGIHAHYFRLPEPGEAENVFPCHRRQLLEDSFEVTIIMENGI